MYDSEDKRYIMFNYMSGETAINIEVDFSMSLLVDKDGTPKAIGDVRFLNGRFQHVQIHPPELDSLK